jgi:hypothetical protein
MSKCVLYVSKRASGVEMMMKKRLQCRRRHIFVVRIILRIMVLAFKMTFFLAFIEAKRERMRERDDEIIFIE